MFVKLALRNIFRNKRRTLITELSIVLGIIAIIFISSFLNGFGDSWGDSIVNSQSAHLSVIRSDYLDDIKAHPVKLSLNDVDGMYAKLDAQPEVAGSIAKLDIGGLIGSGEKSTTFFGSGIDVSRQPKALPGAFDAVVEGKGIPTDDPNAAVLGVGLAKSLDKHVGDSILLAANTIDGQLNAIEVEIVGLVKTKQSEVDDSLVLVSLKAAQNLLAAPNRASQINVRLKPGVKLDVAQRSLAQVAQTAEPKAVLKTWIEMSPEYADVNGMFRGISFIVVIIVFIIVAAGVANTMLMSVFERTREIGTIMAIGTTPRQVTRMFLLEGLCIGILGIIVGLSVGLGLTLISVRTGIHIRPPSSTESYKIVPILKLLDSVQVIILVLVMSVVASFVPAHLASKLDPIDALRRN